MKIRTILMAGAALSMALASCSQKEEGIVETGKQKAVTVSFANLSTRATGDKLEAANKATFDDFYVLFTDNAGNIYHGKTAENLSQNAPVYYENTEAAGDMTFHLLPNNVKKVYVIANPTEEIKAKANEESNKGEGMGNISAIESVVVTAAEQQSVNPSKNADLVLYGVCNELTKVNTEDGLGHEEYYTAKVNLLPLVARIQVNEFSCDFAGNTGIGAFNILQVALNSYYAKCPLVGKATELYNYPITGSVFAFFDDDTRAAWSYNSNLNIELNNTDIEGGSNTKTLKAEGETIYYDIFPGAELPQLLVRLDDTTNNAPYYLATEGFSMNEKGGTALTGIEAGHIYNVNFEFSDSDVTTPEKCVTVTVSVEDWVVETIVPEF